LRKPPIKKQIASDQDTVLKLLGSQFKDKRRLEEYLGAAVHVRNSTITIEERSRSKLERAEKLLTDLLSRAMFGDPPFFQGPFDRGGSGRQYITAGNRRNIFLKTKGQERFYDAVQKHDLVFVIGPAGTGKTYCAVAMAVQCLQEIPYRARSPGRPQRRIQVGQGTEHEGPLTKPGMREGQSGLVQNLRVKE